MKLAVFILVAIAGLMTGTIIYAVRKGNGLTRLSLRRALLTNISCFALIVACAVLMPLSGVYADEEQPVTDVSSQANSCRQRCLRRYRSHGRRSENVR